MSLSNSYHIHVSPQRSLVDDVISIRITGAETGQPITLLARTEDDGKRFFSYAHFFTDGQDEIDLQNSASRGGFYKGIDAMGIFWSMRQEPGQKRGLRIIKRDVTTPLVTSLSMYHGHLKDFSEMVTSKPLTTGSAERCYMASHVTRTEVDLHDSLSIPQHTQHVDPMLPLWWTSDKDVPSQQALDVIPMLIQRWPTVTVFDVGPALNQHWISVSCLLGYMSTHFTASAGPDGGPYHGIIDMFGGIGGTVEHRAALLASRGFATFALQYIDVKKGFNVNTDLDYFKRGVEWLLGLPRVFSDGVGMVGTSKGGEMAMLTSIICPLVKAVVCVGGPDYLTSFDSSFRGEVFHSLNLADCLKKEVNMEDEYSMEEIVQKMPEEQLQRSILPIHRTNSKLLMIYGEDDYCTGIAAYNRIMARMKKVGKEHLVQTLLYPGAGHLLEPPYSPLYRVTFTPFPPCYMLWGGETVGHSKAQKDFWPRLQQFLRHELSQNHKQGHGGQAKL